MLDDKIENNNNLASVSTDEKAKIDSEFEKKLYMNYMKDLTKRLLKLINF